MGTDGSWMVFKAIRLDEIIKEVSRDTGATLPPQHQGRVTRSKQAGKRKEQQVREEN